MNPLSIVVNIASITTTCLKATKTLYDIQSAWERSPLTLSSLYMQLKLTSLSLSQLQSLLLSESEVFIQKKDVLETLDITLTNCLVISKCLDQRVQKLTDGILRGSESNWRTRLRTLWNESECKELLELLQQQQSALGVLLGLLQAESISEMHQHLLQNGLLLSRITNNTRHLRKKYSITAPESILDAGAEESLLSRFIFCAGTSEVVGHPVQNKTQAIVPYELALNSVLICSMLGQQASDSNTSSKEPLMSFPITPVSWSVEMGPPKVDYEIVEIIKILGIHRIHVQASVGAHPSKTVSTTTDQSIRYPIYRVEKHQDGYWGYRSPFPRFYDDARMRFSRDQIEIHFECDTMPLTPEYVQQLDYMTDFDHGRHAPVPYSLVKYTGCGFIKTFSKGEVRPMFTAHHTNYFINITPLGLGGCHSGDIDRLLEYF